MRCELCGNEAEYRYEEQNMCGDCLFDALVDDHKITSCTETTWYLEVGTSLTIPKAKK